MGVHTNHPLVLVLVLAGGRANGWMGRHSTRQMGRQTFKHADKHADMQPGRWAGRHATRQMGRQTFKHADEQADMQPGRWAGRHADMEMGRQMGGHTCKHADGQADRHMGEQTKKRCPRYGFPRVSKLALICLLLDSRISCHRASHAILSRFLTYLCEARTIMRRPLSGPIHS